jgi:hypothetical protein
MILNNILNVCFIHFIGITKTTNKKVMSNGLKIPASKMSKLIYLPLTYLSNAKPIKVLINPFGKR